VSLRTGGISFVVPVHNGAGTIRETLAAIGGQRAGRLAEIVVIDDGSLDASRAIVAEMAQSLPITIVDAPGRGAAAAINTGLLAAQYPVVCQIDQDVVIAPGWVDRLLDDLAAPDVAAAQGYYVTAPTAGVTVRAMGLDLDQRYTDIAGAFSDHVCTGNTAYKAAALHQVGLFDERLGYGYDNDISYRLRAAGYRLVINRDAHSVHHWRDGLFGYLRQQYGFGYGRLDVVAKHPSRLGGDAVSDSWMMAHPLVMAATLVCIAGSAVAQWLEASSVPFLWAAAALVAFLAGERTMASWRAWQRSHDRAALLFVPLHLLRDLVWVAAIAMWLGRRLVGAAQRPVHSMWPRAAGLHEHAAPGDAIAVESLGVRALGLIPAFNEATNLEAVIHELRAHHPHLDLLVIDDGSTDGTETVLREIGVRWLRLPQRLGIGSAMRAGLRYADRLGYDVAIRIDGDGQHRAGDVARLLARLAADRVDVIIGSRFRSQAAPPRPLQRALALTLSWMTGAPVSDPTSGFYAIGPRALRLLADHHPTGYPEPELRLFLTRNQLRVAEVAVEARARLGGKTTLTTSRLLTAGARVLLAMIVVPFRGRVARHS
jgi:glycosyltransferase involved in cell wall biosynthesis